MINREITHKKTYEPLFVTEGSQITEDDLSNTTTELGREHHVANAGDAQATSTGDDQKLKRLMEIYYKAKADFNSTPPKSLDRTRTAKFLRDTVENCLNYLKAKHIPTSTDATATDPSHTRGTIDQAVINELRSTLGETKAIAEKGSGGKKRRFDQDWENVPLELENSKARAFIKTSSNAVPVARRRTPEDSLGRYPVIPYNGHGHPPPVDYRGERIPPARFYRVGAEDCRQHDHRQPMMAGERRRSLSRSSHLHADFARHPPPHSHGSGGAVFSKRRVERHPFLGYENSDTYRPVYR